MLEEESNSATWELSKENILPLKQGRKANILSLALDDSSTSKLSSVRHEFEEELRTYTGDDPLDVWYRYVLWVEQNYPKGGKDGNVMKLIQKCVTSIHTNASTNEKYKNDDRFLTLWVKYANLCPNPLEVYGALDTKGLCTGIAEFYLNWSWEYEKLKNYRKAESIFQKGFQSGALPLDALQEAHKKFQTRVARATLEEMDSEAEGNVAEPQRTVLTSLKVQGRKNRVANERTGSSILGPAGRIPSTQTSINAGASSFSIYQDSSACGGTSGKGSGVDVKRGSLPVGNSLHKENVKEAGPWTKAKASQKSTGVVPVDDVDMYQKPMFTVHQDADGDIAYRTPSKHPEMNNVLSVRKTFEDDDWQVPLFVAEPSDPKVKPQYCKDKVYCGTEEFSFEELMAARYFKIQKEKEMKKQEEEKDAQIKKMEDMLKKQQQMIQQLLQVRQEQAVKPPDIIVSSHDENDAACVAASHKLKCE
ncbi:Budding uninhibited by benzimidazoles 1 beta b, partial [Halocaridina rubra]